MGDGNRFTNGVGAKGDLAFTKEYNLANFTCPDVTANAALCNLAAVNFTSSFQYCLQIESLYQSCVSRHNFNGDNCEYCCLQIFEFYCLYCR